MYKKLMGLDWGERTIGVSLSDDLGIIAIPLETIRRPDERSLKKSVARLREIVQEHDVQLVVLGYPIGMDGREGTGCIKVRSFRDRLLQDIKLEIVLWDERLSSSYVERLMAHAGVSAKKRSTLSHTAASCAILQGYMDFQKSKLEENKLADNMNDDTMDIEDLDDLGEEDTTLMMTDDEGNEVEYTIVAMLEHEDTNYLLAIETQSLHEDDAAATILKEVAPPDDDEGDDMFFEHISEEDEFNTILELFQNLEESE